MIVEFILLWKDFRNMVNVSKKQWMSINMLSGSKSSAAKIYQLNLKNKTVINQKFNKLHKQEKLKWTNKVTKYSFSVFVIWKIIKKDNQDVQKGHLVINIHIFNVITKEDTYPMQTQTDMISQIASACFIIMVNTAAFFYQ